MVVTRDLPPCRTLAADDSTAVVLERQGPGRADIGVGGYAEDTEVVTPSAAALRRTVPATEKWLQLTRQDVNAGKSTVWTLDSDAGQPIQLLGVPIPEEMEFRRLGIGIRVPPARGMGPLLQDRIQRGASVLRRMPQITSLKRRSTVAGLLAMAVALHGVQLADIADADLARLETQTVRTIWGPTKPGRAKEVVFSLLTPGRPSYVPYHAYQVREVGLDGPTGPGDKGRPGPHAGHLGMQGCTPATRAYRTRGPHG